MKELNIIDLVKQTRINKAKQINKSIQGTTYFQNQVNLLGENVKTSKKLGVTLQEHELRDTYYSMLDKYYHKSNIRYYKVNEKSVKFWKQVASVQSKSGVSCVDFIKAQFKWFDKYYRCAPSLPHLITENAIKRAIEFKGHTGNIVSSVVPYKNELASVLQQTDQMIRNIMKAQNLSKEEFYTKLVLTGEFPVAKAYLDIDPIYQKLIK